MSPSHYKRIKNWFISFQPVIHNGEESLDDRSPAEKVSSWIDEGGLSDVILEKIHTLKNKESIIHHESTIGGGTIFSIRIKRHSRRG